MPVAQLAAVEGTVASIQAPVKGRVEKASDPAVFGIQKPYEFAVEDGLEPFGIAVVSRPPSLGVPGESFRSNLAAALFKDGRIAKEPAGHGVAAVFP